MKTETENLPAEGQRSLNGKPVLTEDTFDYVTARVGDYVEQAVVDNAMNYHRFAMLGKLCHIQACHQRPGWHLAVLRALLPWRECGARRSPCRIAGAVLQHPAGYWQSRHPQTGRDRLLQDRHSLYQQSGGQSPGGRIQPQAGRHEGAGSSHVRRLHVWLSCSRCGPCQL